MTHLLANAFLPAAMLFGANSIDAIRPASGTGGKGGDPVIWARVEGSDQYESGNIVALDDDKNIYVAGSAGGNFDGNTITGGQDICLIKYDGSGKKLWTRFCGMTKAAASGMVVDGAKNVYVFGVFEAMDEQPGNTDLCFFKFDPEGKQVWKRTFGTEGRDHSSGLAIGTSGSIYAAGYTEGALDGDANAGSTDFFLLKYDLGGKRLWSRLYGTPDEDRVRGIAVDAKENIYLAGGTAGSLTGKKNGGIEDMCLLKYDAGGTRQWSRQWGAANLETAWAVATDAQGGIYFAGMARPEMETGTASGAFDIWFGKFDGSGSLLWSRMVGTYEGTASSILPDRAGGVYLAGQTQGMADGTALSGARDFFLAKYSGDGARQWARQWGGSGFEEISGMAMDDAGFLYLTGYTEGDLGLQVNSGRWDICLMKYRPFQPSFNCAKAGTLQENLICQSARLSGLDDSIAILYNARLKSSSRPAELKTQQLDWLKSKRNACTTPERLASCMRERIESLKAEAVENGVRPDK